MKITRRGFFGSILGGAVVAPLAFDHARGQTTDGERAFTWNNALSKWQEEDLSDIIYEIQPQETPLLNYIQIRGEATENIHEWWTEDLS